MFRNELQSGLCIKKLNKYLCKTEASFLNRLYFWSSHKKEYGVEKEGRVWIYNTLEDWSEQLGVSKSSVRRTIKSLREKRIINSDYLSTNKRNRTLYYAIDDSGINEYLRLIHTVPCAQKSVVSDHINEHMDGHMYIIDNSKQIINKSYKSNESEKNKIEKILKETSPNSEKKPKNNTAQDALAIWNEEMKRQDYLTKHTARYLVAAIQRKFENSLELWRKYLKRIKTSAYLMGEKFQLWLNWVLKFATIDRILAGEFGTKEPEKPIEKQMEEVEAHIASLDEEQECLQIRRNFIKYYGAVAYITWLAPVVLRKITVQYRKCCEDRIAISMESEALFEYFKNNYLGRHIVGELNIDDENHFQKQKFPPEKTKQKTDQLNNSFSEEQENHHNEETLRHWQIRTEELSTKFVEDWIRDNFADRCELYL